MKRKNIMLSSLLFASVISAGSAPLAHGAESKAAAAAPSAVTFKINDVHYSNNTGKHSLLAAPFVKNGNTMLPVRAAAESLGVSLSWNNKSQVITLSGKSFGNIKFTLNSSYAVNAKGEKIKLPEQVRQAKGMIFVPARSLASLLGIRLQWQPATDTITLTNQAQAPGSISFNYQFSKDTEGWKGGFADLPIDYDKEIYELDFARKLLPVPNNTANYGLKLAGHNRSDDLFMFLSKGIEGFKPNKTYNVNLKFAMYTEAGGGMIGIGGSPAESVFLKAGILSSEPLSVKTTTAGEEYYRMNVDVGSQGTGGKDVKVIGNAAKPDPEKEGYQRVDFEYSAKVTSNAKGEIFVLIGADSGFEGLSTLYFDDIKVAAQAAE
ncbi:copper amine oxidase N-terminal domain-containing protein [Paenibacillus glycanilyticus]|uniref:copper amine oxidase N-terminal domain-containing protein n=1 Tax=Paenibacillus glycanilyticus TaxID=126569 RepID=UPI002042625F|nr:copper amine oxidase N-terminal domain-containing protein [Paenibacillus glycanilyticus]MCM3629475.1 copper amine oxidase N-terminal domain-containing protein [Paenibacillus glycanilyticus]